MAHDDAGDNPATQVIQYHLELRHVADATSQPGAFSLVAEGYDCYLTLQCDLGAFEAKAGNYFDALCLIRAQLEPLGWRPVCYGSSRNVYSSNMCRDQGRGMVAYRTELGHQATPEDLVETFHSGPGIELASVEEQRTFYENWRESLP